MTTELGADRKELIVFGQPVIDKSHLSFYLPSYRRRKVVCGRTADFEAPPQAKAFAVAVDS